MAFKLGHRSGKDYKGSKLVFGDKDASVPGTPVIRKRLDPGIMGEANIDGTIYISDKIEPGSKDERRTICHEMQHMVDIKTGKLRYNDDNIEWNGVEYMRDKGHILFEGKWVPEGSKDFPWEKP